MSTAPEIEYREAGLDDLPGVLEVQRDAFGRVAAQFDIPPAELPPLVEDLEDLRGLMSGGARFFVALDCGRVVGTVRGALAADGTVEIGRMAVSADHMRRGIARALMTTLERSYPSARRLELYTGREAHAPLALYRSLGYTEIPPKLDDIPYLIWLEKPVAPPTAPADAPLH